MILKLDKITYLAFFLTEVDYRNLNELTLGGKMSNFKLQVGNLNFGKTRGE